MMLTQNRKILFSVVAAMGIGFSILIGASLALTYQPPNMMSQQFSMSSNFPPNIGFSGSQFNTMMPNSGQGFGGMSQGMTGQGDGGMNPMMKMMNTMMPGMFKQSGTSNVQSMSMTMIPLAGPSNNSGGPLESAQVISIVSDFLDELNNPDLEIGVLNENSNNFYVAIQEKSTGIYAFDLLVDKRTGAIYAEPGPNMMWNTKYGFMPFFGGTMQPNQSNMQSNSPMMGPMGTMNPSMGENTDDMSGMQSSTMTDSPNQMGSMMSQIAHIQVNPFASTMMFATPQNAEQIAQQFLNTNLQGQTVEKIRMYYGYYTVDVSINGQNYSNLAINGDTGQVWYKTWHSGFAQNMGIMR